MKTKDTNQNRRLLIVQLRSLLLMLESGGQITANDLTELIALLPSEDGSIRAFISGELQTRQEWENGVRALAAAGNRGAQLALSTINKQFLPNELERIVAEAKK